MKKLLVATKNQGKFKEISKFLRDLNLELVSLNDLGISDDFEEKGKTYEENSEEKAKFYSKLSGLPSISDDGGIEIEALGGAPGVNSKRWVGEDSTDEKIVHHMIKVSKTLKTNRKAFFQTVVSLAMPNGRVFSSKGKVEGIIARKPLLKLLKGYPYRSFFYLPQIGKYYHEADLSQDQEKLYNHRYKAIRKLIPVIKKELRT